MSFLKNIFWSLLYLSDINALYQHMRSPGYIACLGYHSISDASTDAAVRGDAYRHLSLPKQVLEEEIIYLKQEGYSFLSLDDVIRISRTEKQTPPRAVLLYFDDGYRDVYLNAYPALKRHGVPAILFLPTDCIDGAATLWDEVPPGEPRIFLSWDEVRAMRDVFMYGSHSKTHPNFKKLTAEEVGQELAASKARIEAETGQAVRAFSFPYGRSTPESRTVLKQMGYTLAFTTQYGFNSTTSNWYDLKKISMKPDDTMMMFKLKLGIYYPLRNMIQKLKVKGQK